MHFGSIAYVRRLFKCLLATFFVIWGIRACRMVNDFLQNRLVLHQARNARSHARDFFAGQGAGRRRIRQIRRLESDAALRKKNRMDCAFLAWWSTRSGVAYLGGQANLRYRSEKSICRSATFTRSTRTSTLSPSRIDRLPRPTRACFFSSSCQSPASVLMETNPSTVFSSVT